MRLEQAPPPVLQFASSDSHSNHQGILNSLDLVDNNNKSTLAQPDNIQDHRQTGEGVTNANEAASVLEAWARGFEDNAASSSIPCTPEEYGEEEDEGLAVQEVNSCVSEGEEEVRTCPSACSSTSSEASELAILASSSSSSGGSECGSTSASDDEQPASPVPPFVAPEAQQPCDDTDEEVRCITENRVKTPLKGESGNKRDMSDDNNMREKKQTEQSEIKPEARSSSSNNNSLSSNENLGAFDVYNIETALPKIDLAQLECQLLAAARNEDRRRRNDREEIRRRLAMGEDDRPFGRKPSLQSRLQSGMNLELCFVNETADCEVADELVRPPAPTLPVPIQLSKSTSLDPEEMQREAQMALAQASARARMEMAFERHQMRLTCTPSPTSQLLQRSLQKVGVKVPPERRRVSRQLLTDMNVTQLQVLVNDLHTLIEGLNEKLVRLLMERDDLHMEQDSRLVDIEDLNRYLGAKSKAAATAAKTQH